MKILRLLLALTFITLLQAQDIQRKKLAYIVTDINIPFWSIMSDGIRSKAELLGYTLEVYNSQNSKKKELQNTLEAIKNKVSGIIVSPNNSSSCATVLKFAKEADIPVVISDIGADSEDYVSYISSDNINGGYDIGKQLSKKLIELGWQEGSVGIVAIPQKRINGQERTSGFMKAIKEANIHGADIKQLNTWTQNETYYYTKEMIQNYPDLKAIWLQTSNIYKGALKAIEEMDKKEDVLLIAFDAEPEFVELISKGTIIGSGMQQPYLMGEVAVNTMDKHLNKSSVNKNIQLPILSVSTENIEKKLPIIRRNVFGNK